MVTRPLPETFGCPVRTVTIDWPDLLAGEECDGGNCPLALAIGRLLIDGARVVVTGQGPGGDCLVYSLGDEHVAELPMGTLAQEYVKHVDAGLGGRRPFKPPVKIPVLVPQPLLREES